MEQRNSRSESPSAGQTNSRGETVEVSGAPRRLGAGNQASGGNHYPESESAFRRYIEILYKRKLAVICVWVPVLAIAALHVLTTAKIYRSEAVIEVSRDSSPTISRVGEALTENLGGGGMDSELFSTHAGILKSRSLAEALAEQMSLRNSPEFAKRERDALSALYQGTTSWFAGDPPEASLGPDGQKRNDPLIRDLMRRIFVKRESQSRLLRVGVEAKDPDFAQKMLDNYLSIFMDQNLDKRRRIPRAAGVWLQGELAKSEEKLVGSMQSLVKFTNEHGMVSVEDPKKELLAVLDKASDGLIKSKEQRVQWEAFQDGSRKDLGMLPTEAKSEDFSLMKQKLALLESEYTNLREVYADDYPRLVLLKKQITLVKAKIGEMHRNLISSALETARTQENMLQQAFEKIKKEAMASNSLGVQFAVLKKEVETNEEIFKLLLQKSKEIELNTQVIGNNIIMVDPPSRPEQPIYPKKGLYLLIGCLLGLVGGMGTALVLEKLDNSVHSVEDVRQKVHLPVLGIVPDMKRLKSLHGTNGNTSAPELVAHLTPTSPVAEAIKNIKTSLLLSAPAGTLKTVLVSSSGPREGKTFISVSLASVLTSRGKKVLIIDGDLRKPRVNKVFGGKDRERGLTTVLVKEDARLDTVLLKTEVPGLYYLPAGPIPPNPVGLLESERMEWVLKRLKQVFDFIILDSPPILGFSDARILSGYADGVVFVVRQGHLPVEMVRQAKEMIDTGTSLVLGTVLNMTEGPFGSYYASRYYRSYYSYYGKPGKNGRPA